MKGHKIRLLPHIAFILSEILLLYIRYLCCIIDSRDTIENNCLMMLSRLKLNGHVGVCQTLFEFVVFLYKDKDTNIDHIYYIYTRSEIKEK